MEDLTQLKKILMPIAIIVGVWIGSKYKSQGSFPTFRKLFGKKNNENQKK